MNTPVPRGAATPVLSWVVLKVAQRCNLDCTYCYVYNRGDDSWRHRPAYISEAVAVAFADRVAEHCRKYGLRSFVVELHGGEPLLLGKERFNALVALLRSRCASVELKIIMQTNGLLLDEEWLRIFEQNDVTFGLSIDGPPQLADEFRIHRDGRGSTRELLDTIAALRSSGPLFDRLNTGALCVTNPKANGAEMVRWFVAHGFRAFDFLLPDGNYANPPPGWSGPEPYLRFMLEAFEEWYGMGPDAPRIRTFDVIIRSFMGVSAELDALGGDLRSLCVVESDGSIGVSDVARFCGGDFSRDSLNLFDHPLDAHATHYDLESVQRLSDQCLECPYLDNCGGGYLPHRFDGVSFRNPSLYCSVLYNLADTVYRRLREDVPASLWREKATRVG